jgi:hypothetical protein
MRACCRASSTSYRINTQACPLPTCSQLWPAWQLLESVQGSPHWPLVVTKQRAAGEISMQPWSLPQLAVH